MRATKQNIAKWFDEGKWQKATHMIVVCDTYDHEDYPVYVKAGEDVRAEVAKRGTDMLRVMEVYSMARPKEAQLDEPRAFHFD